MKKKIRLIKRNENHISSIQSERLDRIERVEKVEKIKLARKVLINHSLSFEEIKDNFYEPVRNLIENDGYNDDGVLIADVNGAAVIMQIIESIMGLRKNNNGEVLNLIQILEENVYQDEIEDNQKISNKNEEEWESESEDESENEDESEDENDKDESEDENDKDDEQEEVDYEDEFDDYKECDVYMENVPDDSMDDY